MAALGGKDMTGKQMNMNGKDGKKGKGKGGKYGKGKNNTGKFGAGV